MTSRLFFFALTSSLAGFLFGFDTVVISGAEKTIQSLWGLGDFQHGLAMSMALWGTVLGSLLGGWPTQRFGRTQTLKWIGGLYLVSAIWSALAPEVISFMVARFLGGVGVGISTVAAPLYISEIAPSHSRGRLAGMFQFNIVFGILVAFLSNALFGMIGDNGWRWMLGVEAVPALIYTILCFTLPESPRWLISARGDRQAGLAVLRQLQPTTSEAELETLADDIAGLSDEAAASTALTKASGFWSRRLATPIMLAFLVAFFNQLSGINAILYFAPRIFEWTGLSSQAALLQSVGIGVVNLIFTFLGLYLIDRLGRKTLLLIGSLGYIASLGICSLVFFANAAEFRVAAQATQLASLAQRVTEGQADAVALQPAIIELNQSLAAADYSGRRSEIGEEVEASLLIEAAKRIASDGSAAAGSGALLVLLCIFAFIAAHAVGQGAVIWVLISEVFPNVYRATGQALGSFTHWIFAASLTLAFPVMVQAMPPGAIFGFFCFMMVLQLIWVITMVPETKGVQLEELQKQLGIDS